MKWMTNRSCKYKGYMIDLKKLKLVGNEALDL